MTIAQKTTDFIGKARTKLREIQLKLNTQFAYDGYQTDEVDEMLLQISETNDFIKLLTQDEYGGFTEKEVSDLIDFFSYWMELNKVIAGSYPLYTLPVDNTTITVPSGDYALSSELEAEITARTNADIALSDRIDELEGLIPDADPFPEDFFDNYDTTYTVVFDDDDRLHTHNNLSILDQITDDDLTRIKALEAHYDSVGDPGGLHVSQADRDNWNAGGGGGGTSTAFKEQVFTADGSTSAFVVTNGVIDQLSGVFLNGVKQRIGEDFSLVDNTIDFGTDLVVGFILSVCYFEGLSIGGGGGGAGVYDLSSPTTIVVGGLPAGSNLTGRTWQSIIEEMAVDFLLPVFSAFDVSDLASVIEVGAPLTGNKTFTWNITNPDNVKDDTVAIRDVTTNTLLATALVNDGVQIVNIGTITNTAPISHTWRAEAENEEDTIFLSPVDTVLSIYPYFYGKVASGGEAPGDGRPTANQALINSGSKVVASSTGTININFNSTSDDYIWFAIPQISASKLSWFVDALNTGPIGGTVSPGGNLFPDPEIVEIDSPTALWNNINYKIYVGNYQSAISVIMQLRNS